MLCSGTVGRETPFPERLEAAAAAGYQAVSLWGRDYQAARDEGYSDADLVALLDDYGLAVAELDPVWWWTPGAESFSIPPELDPIDVFRFDESELFRIGEVLGSRSVNAADVLGGDWGVDDAAESFAALCDRAAEHGLLVHLEWLAWSRIADLDTALEVVTLADRPNGGLNIDMWHCARHGDEGSGLVRRSPPTTCWRCRSTTARPNRRRTWSRRRCTSGSCRGTAPSTWWVISAPSVPSGLGHR